MVHAGLGTKAVAVAGMSVIGTGCVINAPSAPPDNATPSVVSAAPGNPVTSPPAVRPSSRAATPARLTGPGTYTFSYQGAVGTIQVPANIMDPRLEPYGDYRRLAQAPPITYLIAQVTNGSDDIINMYEIVVVTRDGRQIEATAISNYVDSWRDAFAGEDGDVTKYNRGVELSNASNFYLHPGAKGTAILGAKEPIKTVDRVFVYPAGAFARVEARRTR